MDTTEKVLSTASMPHDYKHVATISLLFLALSVVSHQTGIDLWLAQQISLFEGGHGENFPWKQNYWLSEIAHKKGRTLVGVLFILVVTAMFASWKAGHFFPYRKSLLFLVVATLLSATFVSVLKQLTTIPCPYDLTTFGGNRQWVDIWHLFSPKIPAARCYPAGHASGGYAWLAIAFLAPRHSRKFNWFLLPGIFLGLSFGIVQQLRGAHFLSHDLATIAVCWFVSGTVHHLMGAPRFS